MKKIEEHLCFGGTLSVYEHASETLNCTMKFSLYLPPQAQKGDVALLTFLSGLTCTHDNFTTKAGAYAYASKYGIAVLAPDTSPRGENIPDDDAYDFGQGAGFYINATQPPWSEHYKMEDYITKELNNLICKEFPVQSSKQGITGHSMGGHGALTLGLKYPDLYKSISAFAPIVAPSNVPWGQKAFEGYLGSDKEEWKKHDACALIVNAEDRTAYEEILIDQGGGDDFLERELKPHLFADACSKVGQKLTLRIHNDYDHSYYFIQSYIEDHIKHHSDILS